MNPPRGTTRAAAGRRKGVEHGRPERERCWRVNLHGGGETIPWGAVQKA
jgi:hypothetical protein